MPRFRLTSARGEIGGKGYVAYGNSVFPQTIDEHTPPNTWVARTGGPAPQRNGLASGVLGSSLYCTYGTQQPARDNDEYTFDSWVSRTQPPFPSRSAEHHGATVDSKYYVFGGGTAGQESHEYTVDTWVNVTAVPITPFSFAGGAALPLLR